MKKKISIYIGFVIIMMTVFSYHPFLLYAAGNDLDENNEIINEEITDDLKKNTVSESILDSRVILSLTPSYNQNETFNYKGFVFAKNYWEDTATIVGHSDLVGDLIIPTTVTNENGSYTVTAIAGNAFNGLGDFHGHLTIPNTVTYIGESAFSNSGFTGDLIIPDSVTEIGDSAFEGDSDFKGKLILSKNLMKIGNKAFYLCQGFTGDLIIPDNVTEIGDYAFKLCTRFNGTLTLSDKLIKIDDYAFESCFDLTGALVIPDNVDYIGNYAFSYCSGFTGDLTIPNGVNTLGDNAFSNCSRCTGKLKIPRGVRKIGERTFQYCYGFSQLEFSERVKEEPFGIVVDPLEIGDYAFYGCTGFQGNLNIPYGTSIIGNYAFFNCNGFEGSLILPRGINSIGDRAFANCWGLSDTLSVNNLNYMGREVFRSCSGIKKVINRSSWKIDLHELSHMNWRHFGTDEQITVLYSGIAVRSDHPEYNIDTLANRINIYHKLKRIQPIYVGNDLYTISYNAYIDFDGRRHNAVGTTGMGVIPEVKETTKKAYDIFVVITKNGEIINPKDYIIKSKNNKTASLLVESDGNISSLGKTSASFKIKFKNSNYKDADNEMKYWTFRFGILPAKLTEDNLKVSKVKRLQNNSVRFGKAEFSPFINEISSPKPLKLKYSKKSDKTDYSAHLNSYEKNNNKVTITGRNNYYGTVVCEVQ